MIQKIDKHTQQALNTQLLINGRPLFRLPPEYLYSDEKVIVRYSILIKDESRNPAQNLLDGMIFVTNSRCIIRFREEYIDHNMEFNWTEPYSLRSGNTQTFGSNTGRHLEIDTPHLPYFRIEAQGKRFEFTLLKRKKLGKKRYTLKPAGFLECLAFYRTFTRIRNIHFSTPENYIDQYKSEIGYDELSSPSALLLLLIPLASFVICPITILISTLFEEGSVIAMASTLAALLSVPVMFTVFFILGWRRKQKGSEHIRQLITKYLGELQ